MKFPFSISQIIGHSMEPTIKDGSYVLIRKIHMSAILPKQIVSFTRNRLTYVKRVSKIENEKIFVMGDNKSDSFDSENFGHITKNQITGKVVWF